MRWAEVGRHYDSANDPVTHFVRATPDNSPRLSADYSQTASCGVPRLAQSCQGDDRRRSMSLTSEDADPSASYAAARGAVATPVGRPTASPLPNRVTFNRFELNRILNLYGRMVADGEWRDYAIDFLKDRAVFSVYRRASEVPIYRIEKDPRLVRKQGMYSVVLANRLVSRPRTELERVRLAIDRKRAVV